MTGPSLLNLVVALISPIILAILSWLLKEYIAGFKDNLSDLKKSYSSLKDSVSAMDKKLLQIETKMDHAVEQTILHIKQADLDARNMRVDVLRLEKTSFGDLKRLQNDMKETRLDISRIEAKVDTIKDTILTVSEKTEGNRQALNAAGKIMKHLQQDASNTKARVGTLEKLMDDTQLVIKPLLQKKKPS